MSESLGACFNLERFRVIRWFERLGSMGDVGCLQAHFVQIVECFPASGFLCIYHDAIRNPLIDKLRCVMTMSSSKQTGDEYSR